MLTKMLQKLFDTFTRESNSKKILNVNILNTFKSTLNTFLKYFKGNVEGQFMRFIEIRYQL